MTKLRTDIRLWYCCPCCGYPAFPERGAYAICWLCNYEDDGLDDDNPDGISGPNSDYTLTEMRTNFEKYRIMYREINDRTKGIRISDTGYEVVKNVWGKYRWSKGPVDIPRNEIERINKDAV